jgi:hypothetical protein
MGHERHAGQQHVRHLRAALAGASVTDDAYGILVNINSNTVSGAARDALVTLGLDAAGGSSYTDWINHLFASSQASIYANGGGGVWYYFPSS